jgi:TM2 domain-containing membrane protein YozV
MAKKGGRKQEKSQVKKMVKEKVIAVQTTKKPIRKRNYFVALILSIFVGWMGVDRFYVNHIGLGILKLITCGGLGIWWFVDIIMFATKNISYVKWTE